jgi:hypothetical protein
VVAVVVPPGHREMLYDMVIAQFENDTTSAPGKIDVKKAIAEGRVVTTAEAIAYAKRVAAAEKKPA